ncbi:MAG: hypothetical protein CHACPFDD_03769 [Phycisphaerae bacterium]|nr:hypothetical protein [Phycisphaerae bacterium]
MTDAANITARVAENFAQALIAADASYVEAAGELKKLLADTKPQKAETLVALFEKYAEGSRDSA